MSSASAVLKKLEHEHTWTSVARYNRCLQFGATHVDPMGNLCCGDTEPLTRVFWLNRQLRRMSAGAKLTFRHLIGHAECAQSFKLSFLAACTGPKARRELDIEQPLFVDSAPQAGC